MKVRYSESWIQYSLARHSLPITDGTATAAEFFIPVLRFKPDTELGLFGIIKMASNI